jgi:hypothetical protein
VVQVPVVIRVLNGTPLEPHFIDTLTRVPRALYDRTGQDVLDLAPDKGAALARFHMLEIDNLEQLAVNLEDHPVPEIGRANH